MDIWLSYVLTVLVMMSTPGPSHLLMISNSAANGMPKSLATAAGDLTANLLQMLAAGLGLSALILAAPKAFIVIKILGVCYLIWLGVRMLLQSFKSQNAVQSTSVTTLKTLWLQGFATSASNPKAVIFFAALFPQFIVAQHAFWPQFLLLSVTYLVIDGAFLCTYGMLAAKLSRSFAKHGLKWVHRLGGVGILVAAGLLSLKALPRA